MESNVKILSEPGLAYIVSAFETLWIHLTKINSLQFDIETYADMMTLPNPLYNPEIEKDSGPDFFYLDSSGFKSTEYVKMLPVAAASMIRNNVLGEIEKDDPNTKIDINKIIEGFKLENLNNINNKCYSEFLKTENLQSDVWLKEGKQYVKEFMTCDYNQGRELYYTKVQDAEKLKFEKTNEIIRNLASASKNLQTLTKKEKKKVEQGINLSVNDICDIMKKIGISLIYRMESYTCAPTVILVVRILQAAKEKSEKYKTLNPKIYCRDLDEIVRHTDPICALGKYGYALSILEQIGYLYRFDITYCKTTKNPKKCDKKQKKYLGRYREAINYYIGSVKNYFKTIIYASKISLNDIIRDNYLNYADAFEVASNINAATKDFEQADKILSETNFKGECSKIQKSFGRAITNKKKSVYTRMSSVVKPRIQSLNNKLNVKSMKETKKRRSIIKKN